MACPLQSARRRLTPSRCAAAHVVVIAGVIVLAGAEHVRAGAVADGARAAVESRPSGASAEAFGDTPDVYARDAALSVRRRAHPEYDPLGVRIGAFLAFPRLTTTAQVDDNILATPTGAIADAVFAFAPGLAVRSDWNQNAVSLDADAISRQFVAHPSQNTFQYAVSVGGLLDVRRDLTVQAAVSHALTLLPRASDGYALNSVTPLLYDEAAAKLEVTKVFDRLRLNGLLSFEDYRYHDGRAFGGGRLDETFRDRDNLTGDLRVDYPLSASLGLFLDETVAHVSRRASLGHRDATRTLIGSNFELTRLIVGELGVGYLTSDSSAIGARSVGHFAFQGRLEYFPTPLITVTLSGGRTVIDSGLPNSPAFLSSVVALRADYELLRNLIVTARAAGAWDRYQVIARRDRRLSFGLGATYQANRTLGVGLNFESVRRTSAGADAGPGFGDEALSLVVTLRR